MLLLLPLLEPLGADPGAGACRGRGRAAPVVEPRGVEGADDEGEGVVGASGRAEVEDLPPAVRAEP